MCSDVMMCDVLIDVCDVLIYLIYLIVVCVFVLMCFSVGCDVCDCVF